VFQFDQGQIGTLTPSPLFHEDAPLHKEFPCLIQGVNCTVSKVPPRHAKTRMKLPGRQGLTDRQPGGGLVSRTKVKLEHYPVPRVPEAQVPLFTSAPKHATIPLLTDPHGSGLPVGEGYPSPLLCLE